MNTVYIPEKVIPGHSIDNCTDCPHYSTSYLYNVGECGFHYPPQITLSPDIPDWCPLLAGNTL